MLHAGFMCCVKTTTVTSALSSLWRWTSSIVLVFSFDMQSCTYYGKESISCWTINIITSDNDGRPLPVKKKKGRQWLYNIKWIRSNRSINYNVHKLLSISCRNIETLGRKFSSVRNKSCLWAASLCCTTQFTLTWFHFSQELSPLARLSLPWQNPQRLDFPFIWLWFTRPFWPSS